VVTDRALSSLPQSDFLFQMHHLLYLFSVYLQWNTSHSPPDIWLMFRCYFRLLPVSSAAIFEFEYLISRVVRGMTAPWKMSCEVLITKIVSDNEKSSQVELSVVRIIRYGHPHGYPYGYPCQWWVGADIHTSPFDQLLGYPHGYPCGCPCRIIRATDSSTRVQSLNRKKIKSWRGKYFHRKKKEQNVVLAIFFCYASNILCCQ